jgi:hypothetical protein
MACRHDEESNLAMSADSAIIFHFPFLAPLTHHFHDKSFDITFIILFLHYVRFAQFYIYY